MSKRSQVENLRLDADDLRDGAVHVAANVADAAVTAKDFVEPRLLDLVAWLRPRAEKAWHESVKAAAPQVERLAAQAAPTLDSATERLVPAAHNAGIKVGEGITVAHDKVLEELLPRLVAVVNEAAKKHQDVDFAAGKKHHHKGKHKHHKRDLVAVVTEVAEDKKQHHKGRRLLAAGAAGVAVAGYTFWKRSQPQNDPWAEPWDQSKEADFSGTVKETKYRVEEVAEHLGEATGSAVSKGRDLAEEVSEKGADLREDLAEKAGDWKDDLAEKTADVREKAAEWGKDAAAKVAEVARDVEGKVEGLIHHGQEAAADDEAEISPDTVLPIAETVISESDGSY